MYAKWNGRVFLRSPFDVYKFLESPLNMVVLDLDSVKVAFQFREWFKRLYGIGVFEVQGL